MAHLHGGPDLTDGVISTRLLPFRRIQQRAGRWLRAGRRLLSDLSRSELAASSDARISSKQQRYEPSAPAPSASER